MFHFHIQRQWQVVIFLLPKMKRLANALIEEPIACTWLPKELVQILFQTAPDRVYLLVCHQWADNIQELDPDWFVLLQNFPEYDWGATTLSYRRDWSLLCDSLERQVHKHFCDCMRILNLNANEVYNTLTLRHHHPRDLRACFIDTEDEPHRYYVMSYDYQQSQFVIWSNDPKSKDPLLSVTTFIHTLFPPFIEEEMIGFVMASPRHQQPNSRYYGMCREEIRQAWADARTNGTANHAQIECYYNEGNPVRHSRAFQLFLEFEQKYITGRLEPYRTEWTIYSLPLRLIGQVDMLYWSSDPNQRYDEKGRIRLTMYDWKFCCNIEEFSYDNRSGIVECTYNTPDCNYCHYCVQLHLYKYILELHYNVVIEFMALGVFHPDQREPIVKPIAYNARFMRRLIAHRRSTLASRSRDSATTSEAFNTVY